ncbi:flagellar hook-basal body protein [Paenibacillus algicola]|uniref:Flagellar hook-basal body protein n=1 Tax=Paenibacillus algicola TaxID=2565926 RepID=A0A4P8XQI2_9BACL|nr:flagellar hook-basal body protein [Paenibacillus algicola]QCT04595.1 flagellar hook-basal body protein [Paenibacillus algicola]
MNNSMISAMVSMNSMQQKLDVIADNIANANTTGYKSKDAVFEDVLNRVQQHHKDFKLSGRVTPPGYNIGFGMKLSTVEQNMEQGVLKETGNPLDLGIEGRGMFAVRSGENIAYTREGGFHVSPDPENEGRVQLVNNQGYFVLDQNNEPISLPQGAAIAVDAGGQIWIETPAGRVQGQVLKIAELDRPEGLVQMDGNLFMLRGGLTEDEVFGPAGQNLSQVRSGFLEQSNVDLSDQMMKMMEVQRAYQLSARALSSSDTMMNLANTMRG